MTKKAVLFTWLRQKGERKQIWARDVTERSVYDIDTLLDISKIFLFYRSLTHLNHIHDWFSRNPSKAHIVNTLPAIIMLTVTLKRKLIQSNVKLISLLLIMEVSLNLKQM